MLTWGASKQPEVKFKCFGQKPFNLAKMPALCEHDYFIRRIKLKNDCGLISQIQLGVM
jgi:hypothetical protein